jgi:hypothetical protein
VSRFKTVTLQIQVRRVTALLAKLPLSKSFLSYIIIFWYHPTLYNLKVAITIKSSTFKRLKHKLLTYYGNDNCHLDNDIISSQQEVVLQAGKNSIAKYVTVLIITHRQQFPGAVGNVFF